MVKGFSGGSDGRACLQCCRHWFNPWDHEDPLEKEMATHSSILAWKLPGMEEPGGLQSAGSQRVVQEWATNLTSLNKRDIFLSDGLHTGTPASSCSQTQPEILSLSRSRARSSVGTTSTHKGLMSLGSRLEITALALLTLHLADSPCSCWDLTVPIMWGKSLEWTSSFLVVVFFFSPILNVYLFLIEG